MDIKEIGACGVVVVGGVAFGVSQFGLNDVLSEDLKYVYEISDTERATYMDGIALEFAENFDTYIIQTETYSYVGQSNFSAEPRTATFVESVVQEEAIPGSERKAVQAQLKQDTFCSQAEMTMFTEKGWNYRFTLKDSSKRIVTTVYCKANLQNNVA